MWLINLYHEVDILGFLIVIVVGLGLMLMAALFVFMNIMHLILTPRLDPILFNERWFTSAELAMFSAWPFSLMRTGAYMALIGFPKRMVKTKRFKGYDLDLTFSQPTIIAARTFMFIALFIIFLGLSFLLLAFYTFIETEFF